MFQNTKLLLIILTFLCSSIITSVSAQKLVKPPKQDDNTEDLRKAEFPDFVTEVKNGKVSDNIKNLTITAIDGSFVLKAGEGFTPKKFTNGWYNPGGQEFTKLWKKSKGQKVRIDYGYEIPHPDQEKNPDKQLEKIKKEGSLYGIIEFNKVWDECSDQPQTRAYYIDLPPKIIEAAKGGRISVQYDYYKCKHSLPGEKPTSATYTSYVIWLSDIEF